MVLEVLEKAVEYFSLLLNQEVFENVVLLLNKKLLHNLIKVSA